mmetsp:Transcript_16839/g.27933  ORF Transcript_16839/g.27933 Transcript_16839/m.27933 type:complete len:355 (+) Transcript_16839:92-1156(+)
MLLLLAGLSQLERASINPQGMSFQIGRDNRCTDTLEDCSVLAHGNLTGCAEDFAVLMGCPSTCGACNYYSLVRDAFKCDDTHENCGAWARSGECDANPRYMKQNCPSACGTCEAKRTGCNRVNTTSALLPHGMSRMFERALSDFEHFSPVVLSRDPWVLQLDNLIDAAEAEAFAGACKKFDRSLAGDQLSPVRTSTQCWCSEKECMQHPAVTSLTERMLNISMVPYNNAEYFQVLKYEPGQFYKAHHDQQSGHWTPQGVRLYTFFVYLSDVEEGGGTRFTELDIVVTPKLGRGILWPSVFEHDLRTSDKRTSHEALPVVKGIKIAANLWQHLYDFKTPSSTGLCVFLGQNSNHN